MRSALPNGRLASRHREHALRPLRRGALQPVLGQILANDPAQVRIIAGDPALEARSAQFEVGGEGNAPGIAQTLAQNAEGLAVTIGGPLEPAHGLIEQGEDGGQGAAAGEQAWLTQGGDGRPLLQQGSAHPAAHLAHERGRVNVSPGLQGHGDGFANAPAGIIRQASKGGEPSEIAFRQQAAAAQDSTEDQEDFGGVLGGLLGGQPEVAIEPAAIALGGGRRSQFEIAPRPGKPTVGAQIGVEVARLPQRPAILIDPAHDGQCTRSVRMRMVR